MIEVYSIFMLYTDDLGSRNLSRRHASAVSGVADVRSFSRETGAG